MLHFLSSQTISTTHYRCWNVKNNNTTHFVFKKMKYISTLRVLVAFFWAKTTKAVLLSGSLVASFKFPPKQCSDEEELHDRAEVVDAIVARLSLSPGLQLVFMTLSPSFQTEDRGLAKCFAFTILTFHIRTTMFCSFKFRITYTITLLTFRENLHRRKF